MLKKILVAVAIGAAGVGVVSQTKLGSYVATLWHRSVPDKDDIVSPEFELDRIKIEIADVLPKEIQAAKKRLAEANVAIRDKNDEVQNLAGEVSKSEAWLDARGKQLENASENDKVDWPGRGKISFADAKELYQQAVKEHNNRFDRLALAKKEQAQLERNQKLAEREYNALIAKEGELKNAVAKLEMELREARLAALESKSPTARTNTRLDGVVGDIKALHRRVSVQREENALTARFEEQPEQRDSRSIPEIRNGIKRLNAENP